MTRLFVNNQEVPAPPPAFSSLDGIIRHIEENLLPADSVIRQVNLDGLPVDAGNCEADPTMILGDLAGRERIEVFTCSVKEIARESVREAVRYLERAEALTPLIAMSFRDFPRAEAFDNLKQLYDGFYWLTLLLGKLEAVLGVSLDGIHHEGVSLKEHNTKFASILQQLVTAQAQKDFILVADLLEFEVLPVMPVWKSLFAGIAGSTAGSE